MLININIKINKETVRTKICSSAEDYKKNFSGYNFLLLYEENGKITTLEISFKASHFKHLTGVTTENINAYEFFNKAADGCLEESDFEIRENKMANLKLSVLPDLIRDPAYSLKMIGEYESLIRPKLQTEYIAGGEKFCMGFTRNDKNIFVPNTILRDDIRKNVSICRPVLALWRKRHNETLYTKELKVSQKKINEKKLTEQYYDLKSNKFQEY